MVLRVPEDREQHVTASSARSGTPVPPADDGQQSRSVAIAALVLVGLSWLSLALAPDPDAAAEATTDGTRPRVTVSQALPGFQSELAYLPDAAMLGFVEIPGGRFIMGSDPGQDTLSFNVEWWGEGRVQGQPDVPTFYMARYEVTVAQYAAFLNASGHPVRDPQVVQAPPDHPVTWVAWTDGIAYAAWLDEELRSRADAGELDEVLVVLLRNGWRVALPSEAQWEKAARGTDGRIYPWGDSIRPGLANYRAEGTVPVGSFDCPSCAHDLADMGGNVWEWVLDQFQMG